MVGREKGSMAGTWIIRLPAEEVGEMFRGQLRQDFVDLGKEFEFESKMCW